MIENVNINIGVAENNPFISAAKANDNQLQALLNQYSEAEVGDALSNVLGSSVADLVKASINSSGMPDFIKDLANATVEDVIADERSAGGVEAEEETEDIFEDVIQQMLSQLSEDMSESIEEAGGGSEGESSGNGGGNWLSVLAKAMGDVAGKHLGNSVRLSEEISDLSESGIAAEMQATMMPGLQAQMQAETQMFKLTQEAIGTIIKSVGEALSSTARKQ